MTPSLEIELGPHWWEAGASTFTSHMYIYVYICIYMYMIADDRGLFPYNRRRSQRELFPYDTISELTEAIHFVQRKCTNVHARCARGKIIANNMADMRRKFGCKQIYFFF